MTSVCFFLLFQMGIFKWENQTISEFDFFLFFFFQVSLRYSYVSGYDFRLFIPVGLH